MKYTSLAQVVEAARQNALPDAFVLKVHEDFASGWSGDEMVTQGLPGGIDLLRDALYLLGIESERV